MTTGQMLILVLPLMAFVLCVAVWLHMSGKRIDRMQAEADAEKARAAAKLPVVTVPPMDPEMVTAWEARVAQAVAAMRAPLGQPIAAAKSVPDAPPRRAPRRKAKPDATAKAGRPG